MASSSSIALTNRLDAKAAVWAGLIAGVVFIIMEMVLVTAMGESPWGPPRMMAAMMMGKTVLPPPASFDLMVFMVAMLVHFVLSVLLALAFAWAVRHRHFGMGGVLALGAASGLLIYLVNFYPVTAILFPWFALARNWGTISSHVVFGIVLAWGYIALARREPARIES